MKISTEDFKKQYLNSLKAKTGKSPDETTAYDRYLTLGNIVREYLAPMWVDQNEALSQSDEKQVYYFSMEFLTGKFLAKNLEYIDMLDTIKEAFDELGYDFDEVEAIEKDPGLGNGGLGRLAAGFLDSLACTGYAGHGCGIRYNYGLFEQKIVNGYQVEFPDRWLDNRNVWEIKKADRQVIVEFGGYVTWEYSDGKHKCVHHDTEKVVAIPYDTPVLGYKNDRINTLRLFAAEPYENAFDFRSFSSGDYHSAFAQKHTAESISQVLYPNDNYYEGKLLRLKQEYFLVSAGVQSLVRTFTNSEKSIKDLPKHISLHINDTHPSLIIPELMRILMDVNGMEWDEAWDITTRTCSYTNHTILSEALETWPINMLRELLPRVTMIIEEINRRFAIDLDRVYRVPEHERERLYIIHHDIVHMANLCIVASNSVNGVAKLHTEILKHRELNHFYRIFPHKFNNKTNGITHRRWLIQANRELSDKIDTTIGARWQHEPVLMERLLKYQDDRAFLEDIEKIKYNRKVDFAEYIKAHNNIIVDPNSIFDIQAKRLHEYKRQLMNAFHIMYLYNKIMDNPGIDVTPRTFIFGAKAAPGYHIAKSIIRLISSISNKIEKTPQVSRVIKTVFMENYSVSLAEKMIPSADVSEQISTASKEASGTGNMKFMMNGAVTVGTLDGANVEIKDAVGDSNIYIFGMTADEVYAEYESNTYSARAIYEYHNELHRIINQLTNGFFDDVARDEYAPLVDTLLRRNDEFFVLKDFDAYIKIQEQVGIDFVNREKWNKMALNNIAKSGIFSSDYTIKEYAQNIWKL